MMNRPFIKYLFLFVFFVPADIQSQEAAGPEVSEQKHRLGLSSIGILERLANSSVRETPDFLITYRYAPGRIFLRAGINPLYYSGETTHDGFTDKQDSLSFRMTARIGAGMTVFNNARWQVDAGIDAVGLYAVDELISDSGFDMVSDQVKKKGIGGGPFISLSYKLNNRISLGTDAGIYVMYSESKHTMLFENFPDFNDELDKSTVFELQTLMPSTIYLQFQF